MNALWLFDSCGYIIGPAILLAGLCGIVLCLWASRNASTRRTRQWALAVALAPIVIGLIGVVFGYVVWQSSNIPETPWGPLGKVLLAGVVVAAGPLLWATLLLRRTQWNAEGGTR